jgi:nucleoside-diphosphate-sugar epimerase
MKILLTGGTGYIGSAVLDRLIAAEHQVTAIVRSQKSSLRVTDAGATAVIGDLFDKAWLASELEQHDAAIHTAGGGEHDAEINDTVIDAVLEAFSGTAKPFIHTGGIWAYGNNASIHESHELKPPAVAAWRAAGEQRLLESDIKASVIQPGIVYGHGRGIPAMLTPEDGTLTLFGSGEQRWVTVHVDDLAELYVLALDNAPGGEAYVGASGHNPTVRELGEAVAENVTPESDEATVARLGGFGEALLLDQQASGEKARSLGWSPSRPSLVEELRAG